MKKGPRKPPARLRTDARLGPRPAGLDRPDFFFAKARALELKLQAIDPLLADELADAIADVIQAGLLLHGELVLKRTARNAATGQLSSALTQRATARRKPRA